VTGAAGSGMTSMVEAQPRARAGSAEPWQLRLFRRTLKKQQKLQVLQAILGDLAGRRCVLVTCGDNNGALNWHLKKTGGEWSWVDAEAESVEQIGQLTGDPVFRMDKDRLVLPYADGTFEDVVAIDVHEHLQEPGRLNRELSRIAAPGGRVIVTTPNGDERKLAVRLKRLLGMTPEVYGHVVVGYRIPELKEQLEAVGLRPYDSRSYSFFFTEMLELALNLLYVKVLAKRGRAPVRQGQIAPQSREQLTSVGKSYRVYALVHPILRIVSKLDFLDSSDVGYAVFVAARKGA